ncbi:MAG: hypothetical protein JOZ07_06235 [Solirubrobacterales bacterium]|nr:hypothetical protein [Solirubrobacterales bacterium]
MAERRIGVLTTTSQARAMDLGRALRLLAGAVLLTFCMINVHEIGHTVAARLAGDPHASYALYETYPSGRLQCLGCNHYDAARLSFWGRFLVSVAGVLATQLVALAALMLAALSGRRPSLAALVLVFVVFVLGDAVYQTLQALTAPVATQTGLTNVDFADALFLLREHWHLSAALLKVLLAVATAAWTLLATWAAFAWLGPAPVRRSPRARRGEPVIAARPGGWKS